MNKNVTTQQNLLLGKFNAIEHRVMTTPKPTDKDLECLYNAAIKYKQFVVKHELNQRYAINIYSNLGLSWDSDTVEYVPDVEPTEDLHLTFND